MTNEEIANNIYNAVLRGLPEDLAIVQALTAKDTEYQAKIASLEAEITALKQLSYPLDTQIFEDMKVKCLSLQYDLRDVLEALKPFANLHSTDIINEEWIDKAKQVYDKLKDKVGG